jgi:hypothetical protein
MIKMMKHARNAHPHPLPLPPELEKQQTKKDVKKESAKR